MQSPSHVWMRLGAAAALGALVLATMPSGREAAAAGGPARGAGWIHEDLAAAQRSNVLLDGGGLRAAAAARQPMAASARGARGSTPGGIALFPAHGLGRSAGAVQVAVDGTARRADVVVEARGQRADGVWTEWREAADATAAGGDLIELPDTVSRIQLRVGFTPQAADGRAGISGVRFRPVDGAAERRARPREPYSARLYATRIGLVGNRTANGHVIRSADHFVALPSRRGLAAKGGGDYTVRVCAERRCAYVPVWDVGPWNIKDDHWNPGREMWTDLPHGKPQAQAAHEDGYNRGVDGFGRRVRNPAGIDLADGTFREALRLPGNAWVDVDYLWTAGYTHPAEVGTRSKRHPLIVRSGPATTFEHVGLAAHAAMVDVACRAAGQLVDGPFGRTDQWLRIGPRNFVPAAYASGGDTAPRCSKRRAQAHPEAPVGLGAAPADAALVEAVPGLSPE
ncbi:hypothetical protein [Marinitenerispora sediminis]|uniref:hypothetical protein n=1 Tax=Marinitenerispora sediminis TaxID=1931232 RepID=UPI0015F197C3|nr:hypothetical protein [Marinitenerispora sediminis]